MKIDNGRLTAYAYSLQQPRNFPPNTCVEGSTRTLRRDSVKAGARGPELPGARTAGQAQAFGHADLHSPSAAHSASSGLVFI